MKTIFEQFLHAWDKLDLQQVQFGCQYPPITQPNIAQNFAWETT